MDLNLPVWEQLSACENLLVVGMGGGFDVFCGLPIYFELCRRGKRVHLANYSFADLTLFDGGIRLNDTLVGVTAQYEGIVIYFPELYLSRWFRQKRQEEVAIWCFQKTGAAPLLKNYEMLVEHLGIDGVLLIDGGVDSLVRGDESDTGALIEDAISLFAVNELTQVHTRILGCTALGAEQDLAYAQIFENMAALTASGGFLGACSLAPQMSSYQDYEEAVLYVQGQDYQDPSVINSSMISAVRGHYGDYHLTTKTRGSSLWISPLMALYWFYDLAVVAAQNRYLGQLRGTATFMEAVRAYGIYAQHIPRRARASIPLP